MTFSWERINKEHKEYTDCETSDTKYDSFINGHNINKGDLMKMSNNDGNKHHWPEEDETEKWKLMLIRRL